MLKTLWEMYWPYALFFAIMALASWSNHRHNQNAARKGENPRSLHFSFGRNSFRKEPEIWAVLRFADGTGKPVTWPTSSTRW